MASGPTPPRYSARPIPAAAYRPGPGAGPRPRFAPPEPLDARRPERCATWLHGVDLYNHGRFWECHEVLEGLWRACPARAPERALLRGLIQLAAARLKRSQGVEGGARRLCARAVANLAAAGPLCLGVRTGPLARAAEAWAAQPDAPSPALRLERAPAPAQS